MTTAAWTLLALAGVAAATDWVAVAARAQRVEYVAKPAALALLLAVALTLDPVDPAVRAWFVVALVLSLTGDVFLMLPHDLFVFGLGSFLLGHVAYVVGFLVGGQELRWLVLGVAVVSAAAMGVGTTVLRAVRRGPHPGLLGPVVAYMVVISAMVATAFGSGIAVAAAGAVLFFGSDSLIALRRFVGVRGWMPVTIMVTYHLGQAGLVASLVV
ncbi:MAG: lysoplasmalogenase [Acidimicrobiales bacterium]|nr:lysoplasmalogenase [Acidimicrobiales bacterium]